VPVPPEPQVVAFFKRASFVGSLACLVLAMLVMLGWALDLSYLKSGHPSLPSMKPNTAIGFALAGTALILMGRRTARSARTGRWLACAIVMLGGLTLVEYAAGWNLGIDELLFVDATASGVPGRMSGATAINFVLIGAALLALDVSGSGPTRRPTEWMALLAAFSALLALLGHAYGVESLYRVPPYTPVALHTALGFLVLSVTVLFQRPDEGIMRLVSSDSPAGTIARRLLPAAVFGPAFIGWLRLQGERAGLYDNRFGLALFASTCIVMFVVLVWWNAHALLSSDRARRTAEATVQDSEEDLRLTLWSIGDGVISADSGGRVTRMNPVAERLTGWAADEAMGRSLDEVLHIVDEKTRQPMPRLAHACADGATLGPSTQGLLLSRDGIERAIADSGAPIRAADGEHRGTVIVFRDQTEERRAARELRESEARKTAVMDAALDAIVVMNHDGRIAEFNAGAERTFGYHRHEVLGQPLAELLVPSSLRDRHDAGLARYLACGEHRMLGQRMELPALRRDGSEFPAEVAIVRIAGDGPPVFTGYIRDVTDRRRAAEAEALRLAKETAEAANVELEAFSYSVAHDLRAPLRAINGFSAALAEDCADQLDAEGRHLLGKITRGSVEMSHLIDGLLDLSRLSRAEIHRKSVNLTALARDVVEQLRAAAPERSLEFVAPDDLVVEADPHLSRVLLENLLNNAWKFSRGRTPARIELGREEAEGAPAFFVRDNGAGFNMARMRNLFAPFRRLHSKEQFEGDGIGLATVHRIIRRHGGRVWAEGEEGQGATFHFTLGAGRGDV